MAQSQKPMLVILAAGMGSRFGGLKQKEPVGPGGEFLIDYAIYDARRAGFGTIVFVITRKIEAEFRALLEGRYGKNADFGFVFQELDKIPSFCTVPVDRVKPWGTGHAVLMCKDAVNVPFAVINADDYYGRQSFVVLYDSLAGMGSDSNEMVMVGFEVEKTLSLHGSVSRGVCTVLNGHLVSVVEREKIRRSGDLIIHETPVGEKIAIGPRELVSMNCWGFAPKAIFPMLESGFIDFYNKNGNNPKSEFYLPTVINDGLAAKSISVKMLNSGEQWFGLTYPEDLAIVKQDIRKKIEQGIYPERL